MADPSIHTCMADDPGNSLPGPNRLSQPIRVSEREMHENRSASFSRSIDLLHRRVSITDHPLNKEC